MMFVLFVIGVIVFLFLLGKEGQKLEEQKEEEERLYLERIEDRLRNFDTSLEPIKPDINLTRKEVCYKAISGVTWYENRKVRTSVSYAGVRQRITIAKGLSFTIGNVRPLVHSHDELKPIEYGNLYVTDKKILLIGQNSSKRIMLNKIVRTEINYNRYNETLVIKKETGKDVHLDLGLDNSLRCKFIIDTILTGNCDF